ncbi:hypothetical protein SLEP1_g21094 [Rubroshorea leprosula]|uniref:t-SNARE coiled-coil homology domain-containing protein n=1 Tax=Rubroshorea leprosula TaxID=152421 RepID=A0AAV5JE24_9ROSI|nr:hypothetical protein SLEP1_g21094 [Rubroshorea leprosula]
MSSSDNEGNGVPPSGNVVNNNRANNSGIGSGSQNNGQGSGSNYGSHFGGNFNVGPGAGGWNSGPRSGSINELRGPANFLSEDKTTEKSVGRGTEPASTKTENSHGAEKDKANLGKVEFSMARHNTVENLDEQIEQRKHVEEMEKSLAKMTELVLKLEKGLMSIKAFLLCCLFACLLAAFYCAKYGTWATLP